MPLCPACCAGDDLLRICRWFDLPASKERLLKALLDKQHSAYHSLQGLVLQQMQVRSGGRRGRMLAGE